MQKLKSKFCCSNFGLAFVILIQLCRTAFWLRICMIEQDKGLPIDKFGSKEQGSSYQSPRIDELTTQLLTHFPRLPNPYATPEDNDGKLADDTGDGQ